MSVNFGNFDTTVIRHGETQGLQDVIGDDIDNLAQDNDQLNIKGKKQQRKRIHELLVANLKDVYQNTEESDQAENYVTVETTIESGDYPRGPVKLMIIKTKEDYRLLIPETLADSTEVYSKGVRGRKFTVNGKHARGWVVLDPQAPIRDRGDSKDSNESAESLSQYFSTDKTEASQYSSDLSDLKNLLAESPIEGFDLTISKESPKKTDATAHSKKPADVPSAKPTVVQSEAPTKTLKTFSFRNLWEKVKRAVSTVFSFIKNIFQKSKSPTVSLSGRASKDFQDEKREDPNFVKV